jgi:hypothetical protein
MATIRGVTTPPPAAILQQMRVLLIDEAMVLKLMPDIICRYTHARRRSLRESVSQFNQSIDASACGPQ